MNMHKFSDAQATHALAAVLTLMKERRFFLFRQGEYSRKIEGDLGHGLDPSVFLPALQLEDSIRSIYATTTKLAEENIWAWERSLGFKAPDLSDNKQLVKCNRYTGGLDICEVYPTTAFTELAPMTLGDLRNQEVKRLAGNTTPADYSPNDMKALQDLAEANASKIWEEIEAVKALGSGNSCVVLLKTRFAPTNTLPGDDFLQGRLDGIQLFPHVMGYLFYEYSKRTRIVRHSHVVFNSSQQAHVNVKHWSSDELSLRFDAHGGYSCEVYFLIVL